MVRNKAETVCQFKSFSPLQGRPMGTMQKRRTPLDREIGDDWRRSIRRR